ncbi:MAG: alpha/beta hydrolase, partial [Myxococcaceae bacterium]|nr:alpha/beta hydrolase [Myxococcaceae bacterium]
MTPRQKEVQCLSPAGLHRMAYAEWGDPANPKVLVCVHGFSRMGSDFDELAQALCHEYRVVCPDVVGRGRSEWLSDPKSYQVPQYVADMVTLLARVDARSVHWFGTSMGGLIGMAVASLPGSPIERLVLNDIGPSVDPAGLQRIASYHANHVGKSLHFADFAAAVDFIATHFAPFGRLSWTQWERLTRDAVKPDGSGFAFRHDARIALPFTAPLEEQTAASKVGELAMW